MLFSCSFHMNIIINNKIKILKINITLKGDYIKNIYFEQYKQFIMALNIYLIVVGSSS